MSSTSMPPPPSNIQAGARRGGDTAAPSNGTLQSENILLPSHPAAPAPVLTTETAVRDWPNTPGYRGYISWLKRRCTRIQGRSIIDTGAEAPESLATLLNMLDNLIAWIEEVPPQPQKVQRFGNLAFREYIALVEERLPPLLAKSTMSQTLQEQVLPLFLNSHAFGHPTRMDYGTGHELAFALALWCCVVAGWVASEDDQDDLVLRVFPRYLDLTTKLQVTYRLEPAGSHGVWGLDDYHFLPYLFGSAQLLGSDISPSQALEAATRSEGPFTDLYTLSLHRIALFKRGAAFSEHSPLLNSLSQFPNWVKPHGGLLKMYVAEVLGKRVVVQGLWVGGWTWGEDLPKVHEREAISTKSSSMQAAPMSSMAAPWSTEGSRGVGTIPHR